MIYIIFIIAVTAVALAYYFIQKDKIRRDGRRERMQRKQEELLERLRSSKDHEDPA